MSIPQLDSSTELIISQRMAAELEDYLKSDVLYWHVSEPNPLGSHMPQLTIGALLEALTRAEASRMPICCPASRRNCKRFTNSSIGSARPIRPSSSARPSMNCTAG